MKLIYALIALFVFSFPAYAEQPVIAPEIPQEILSWENLERSCTTKDKRVIRVTFYFREHAGGETQSVLSQQFLNGVLVVQGTFSIVYDDATNVKIHVQHPRGKWTLYDQKVAGDSEKALKQTLRAFDLTEEEYLGCLDRMK